MRGCGVNRILFSSLVGVPFISLYGTTRVYQVSVTTINKEKLNRIILNSIKRHQLGIGVYAPASCVLFEHPAATPIEA